MSQIRRGREPWFGVEKVNKIRYNSLRWLLHLVLAATIGMTLLAGCWRSPSSPSAPPPVSSATFVGNAACVVCHPDVSKQHSHSRHAQTLRLVSPKSLGKLSPPVGKIPGTDFAIAIKDGQFVIGAPSQSDDVAPLKYALGSGKTGMTYVFPIPDGRLVEARLSYFPNQKQWYTTPGQGQVAADEIGAIHPNTDGQKCILCHAVTIQPDTLTVEKPFFGVGCESCHGAGSTHVAAMQNGDTATGRMEKLSQWPAERLNTMCGKCHGTKADVQVANTQAANMMTDATNRLQAYGLMESECYKKSNDTLSCITCHNPHTNVSTNQTAYEAVCLSCHSTAARLPSPAKAVGKVCPVNPKTLCISCHMPSRQAIPGTKLPTLMADHFIRVHK